MNILCRESEKLKPFYEGGGGGDNCIYTVTSLVVNWSFWNIDLEMEKTHPRIQNAEEKDEHDNDSVKSFIWTGKLS